MVKPKAKVDRNICLSCGGCVSVCPQDAVILRNLIAYVDPNTCISCEICANTCAIGAIHMGDY
jgi:ferredoxin